MAALGPIEQAAPDTGTPVLSLHGIALSYSHDGNITTILRDLDLFLAAGEFVALLGPSGVGKSTLLRIAMGLVQPSVGRVQRPPDRIGDRRSAALVFQDAKLLPWRRVLANVELGLEGLGLSRPERHIRAMQALAQVGLEAQAARWPHQLSGGQRQRVGVARALTVDPDMLLMDEPFGALDAITRAGLQDELLRLWQETHKTVLFVTHDIDEALFLADRVIVLAGSPASVRGEFRVGRRPRVRGAAELQLLAERLRALLADQPEADWRGVDI
jgi:NitT/TauT family transport system ATP-binding protein